MTREEFINDINDWQALLDFCYDNDCHICDNVYSQEVKDDYVNQRLVDEARSVGSWYELYQWLDDIPDGSDYYVIDDYGDIQELDDYDDFDRYKEDVLNDIDEEELWDVEEEDEDSDADNEAEIENLPSVEEIFAISKEQSELISSIANKEQQEIANNIIDFMQSKGDVQTDD